MAGLQPADDLLSSRMGGHVVVDVVCDTGEDETVYTAQQLDDMRNHPDRQRLLAAILDAHDALLNPTPTSREVVNRIRSGQLEVLFDENMPALGGLAPGENPCILGGQGILGNPLAPADHIRGLMMSTLHEGVHHLDVIHGRSLPGALATVEQRFFTELHAYTAEFELATANGLVQHLHTEFWGARDLNDISNSVLTVESHLVPLLSRQPGLEQAVVQRVKGLFPAIP